MSDDNNICPKCGKEMKEGQWGAHVWRHCMACGYEYRVRIIGEELDEN